MYSIQAKNIIRIVIMVGVLLLIPLLAMQFTEEVQWDAFDFLIAGAVLLGVGFVYETIAKRSEKTVYRVAFGIGLLGALLLFWVNGAVGIIGSENQTVNLLYGAVFVIGFVGVLTARFKAHGMAWTLLIATIVQMLVPVVGLIIWPPPETSWAPSVFGVFVLSGFFALLFFVSALLFQRASASL